MLPDSQLDERISQAVRPGEHMDLDELVGALRDVYPEYRRQKLTPFSRRVQGVLEKRGAGDSAQPQSLPQVRRKLDQQHFLTLKLLCMAL